MALRAAGAERLFLFLKTPNCFISWRLALFKGAPLFKIFAEIALLENGDFRGFFLRLHAGKQFGNIYSLGLAGHKPNHFQLLPGLGRGP